jgi:hypothetical protein
MKWIELEIEALDQVRAQLEEMLVQEAIAAGRYEKATVDYKDFGMEVIENAFKERRELYRLRANVISGLMTGLDQRLDGLVGVLNKEAAANA